MSKPHFVIAGLVVLSLWVPLTWTDALWVVVLSFIGDGGRDFCLRLVHDMLRIRRMEERCAELYGEEKIGGFLHLYIGEEAVATGVMPNLRAEDALVATYREHGLALLRGVSINAIMAAMCGKREGWIKLKSASLD